MPFIADYALDGLVEKVREATRLFITSQEATTWAQASSTYNLGTKTSPTMGAVSDRTGGGRKTTISAITDGTVNSTGTATHWALADHANERLLATGSLTSSQSVTSGNTFSLTAFDVGVPDAV
jgi:hypothetical protein